MKDDRSDTEGNDGVGPHTKKGTSCCKSLKTWKHDYSNSL